ncbi:MAG: helix-turn-helix transcriptional regulator [Desulfobacteraceae bacterium]|nr:helix-turn-helix transcriptional regulator [Desulfobacteraceae bacterium]
MNKSIFTADYGVFLRILRKARQDAGLTQEQLAERLGQTQSFISKCERGERRLDVVEIRRICQVMELSFVEFIETFENALE